MSPREEKVRRLIAELADELRSGIYPPEAAEHLDNVARSIQETLTTQVDGTGEIVLPIADLFQLTVTEDGIGIGASDV